MFRPNPPTIQLDLISRRAIRTTETFLEQSMRDPQSCQRIPIIKVGSGSFSPAFAQSFWSQVLELNQA